VAHARLNLQRESDAPTPAPVPSLTPVGLGHHFGQYGIVAPELRDQHAPNALFPASSLQASPWASWGSHTTQEAPHPLTALQRAPAGFEHDLEHDEEQHAPGTEHTKPGKEDQEVAPEASVETSETSGGGGEAEGSSGSVEAAPTEAAPEASAGGDTAEADHVVSSEDAAGVAEAQASPEAELEAQKADSSVAGAGSPNETPEANADQKEAETSNETVAETSSQNASEPSSEAAPESSSKEAAPEPSSETAETSASTETTPEPVSSSEPSPETTAQAPTEEPSESSSLQASTSPEPAPSPTEEPEEETPVQALRLQASAATSSAARSSAPDTSLNADVRSLSGGQALEPGLRSELESFHRTDLTSVQTFVDPSLTSRVQARAFTTGDKIVFNNAGDLGNRELLAHETAHVKQQASGEVAGSSIAPGVKLSDPSDSFEREATSLGASFAQQPRDASTPSSTQVSRDAKTPSQTVFSGATSSNTPVQRSAWSWIKDKASSAWDGMKNLAGKGWDWVKDKASAVLVLALETAGKAFGSTGARIVEGLKSVGSAIMGILQNPGAFISNLIAGVKTGFMNFASNAKSHLTGILGQWLTGNSGVHFPTKFEPLEILQSIFSTVGASWSNLRGKITGKLGPGSDKAISIAEKSVPLVTSLSKGQFHNLEDVKAQVLPAVKSEAVEGLKEGVKTTVLQQGAIALLSRLNPAGGLITIFKTVQFLVEKASSIASFVSSIWGGITNIAKGDVGGAAAKVESSLVSGVSLALNFLSKQIGLDGIVKKVQTVIHSISSRVNKVLDFVAGKAVKLVQPIVDKIKGGFTAAKTFATNTLEKGKVAGANLLEKGKQFLNGIFGKKSFTAGGENHSIWVNVANGKPTLMIASTPREASAQLDALEKEAQQKGCLPKVQPLIADARGVVNQAKQELAKGLADPAKADEKEMTVRASNIVGRVEGCIKSVFDELKKHAGASDSMPLTRVEFDAKSYDAKEYKLQLAEQQNAINLMTIKHWVGDRSNFLAKVGDPIAKKQFYGESGKYQEEKRKEAATAWRIQRAEALEKQYISEGMKKKDAQDKAENQARIDVAAWMGTQAALHMPDKIAGGKVDAIYAMGDLNVNSSVGSSWKTRIQVVDSAVKKIDPGLHDKIQMNVHLTII
jgi:Novel toxin 15/Domain of unknown function (DUF4157)